MSQLATLAVVAVIVLFTTVGSSFLPVVIVGNDYSTMAGTLGPWIFALNLIALIAAVRGIASRTWGQRGVETWALVAIVGTLCDTSLYLIAGSRLTSGWYAALALSFISSAVVLVPMLFEFPRLHRQMREHADQLVAQNAALVEAQSLRDHLIAVVTHEMRTPLGGLRGYLEILMDADAEAMETRGPDHQPSRITLRAHERSMMLTQRLTLLTEDLLAVASADHGKLVIRPETVDLSGELAVCAAGFPDLDLRVRCVEPMRVWVDPLRLQQVLANLVGNAAKYGRAPVTIEASEIDGAALISVTDLGDGVPEDFIPRLFERYSRAPGASEAGSGSGLGLSVVRDLVGLHGGTVVYDPRRQAFDVTLPTSTTQPAPSVPTSITPETRKKAEAPAVHAQPVAKSA